MLTHEYVIFVVTTNAFYAKQKYAQLNQLIWLRASVQPCPTANNPKLAELI